MAEQLSQLQVALAGRYTIERELGRGGMATVYLAQDRKHGRRVAIKVLRSELAAVVGPERFAREIEIAARLSHPHILPLHESGETDGLLYYVMPYVEGESLRDRIKRERQLSVDEAVQIARQVASALAYSHSHEVVHRDVKPENILLSGGEAVLADFGIARALLAAGGEQLTETGIAIGTPAYMSPEQSHGAGELDGRSDLYSLGCVLYEMLAGHPPFLGTTSQEVFARHMLDPVPPLRSARAAVPDALEQAVLKMLGKLPADRFATASQVSEALAKAAHHPGSAEPPPSRLLRMSRTRTRQLLFLAGALTVLGTGYTFLWRRSPSQAATTTSELRRSIAVLPFVNLSTNRDDEYFSDGIAEELSAALRMVAGLRVVGWASTLSLKGSNLTPDELGAKLDVGSLLRARVRRSANRVRVNAELINTADGKEVWSHQYEREVRDVFAVQEEISRAIVNALQVTLAGAGAAPLVPRLTASSEAYDRYLKGRYFVGRRGREDLRKAVEHFEAAIRADPAYASAYAGLSYGYSLSTIFGHLAPDDGFPRARAPALKALQLDSTLAEAHTSLGIISIWYDWDRSAAGRSLARATSLDPQYAPAHLFTAWNLISAGDTAGAIRAVQQARELDPLSVIVNTRVATMLYFARRYDEAVTQLNEALDLDSTNVMAHAELARVYLQQGRCEQALGELRFITSSWPNYEGGIAGFAKARCGRRGEALRTLADLKERAKREFNMSVRIAVVHLALGEKDSAFQWLGRAVDRHEAPLVSTGYDPWYDELRGDPRWTRLMSRLRLDP